MRETTDTNGLYPDKNIPDGKRYFIIQNVVGKPLGGAYGYVWKLEGEEGQVYEQILFPNELGPLLKILQCTEVSPGKFEWDTEAVVGQRFSAVVSHVPDKKKPDVMRQKMTDFDEVPF